MESKNEEFPSMEFSDRFKRRMNRMFREEVGTEKIPHPEVDNGWERMRSGVVCLWRKMRRKK